jgi:hypothetical protein
MDWFQSSPDVKDLSSRDIHVLRARSNAERRGDDARVETRSPFGEVVESREQLRDLVEGNKF